MNRHRLFTIPKGPSAPPMGNQGPQGFRGRAGPQGPAGSSTGTAGPTGATGAIGPAGVQGPTGVQGGSTGFVGPTGLQGPTGPQGGSTGSIGPTGPQGPTGPSGTTSPYQYQPGSLASNIQIIPTGSASFNSASAQYAIVLGGTGNISSGVNSTILNGVNNRAGATSSCVLGGSGNVCNSAFSTIVNGIGHLIGPGVSGSSIISDAPSPMGLTSSIQSFTALAFGLGNSGQRVKNIRVVNNPTSSPGAAFTVGQHDHYCLLTGATSSNNYIFVISPNVSSQGREIYLVIDKLLDTGKTLGVASTTENINFNGFINNAEFPGRKWAQLIFIGDTWFVTDYF